MKNKNVSSQNELTKIGHWEVINETKELFWSDEIYCIHGLKPGSKVDIETAIKAYHPDDRNKVIQYIQNALDFKENFQFELRIIDSKGGERQVVMTGFARPRPDGSVPSVFGIFQDITNEKTIADAVNKHKALAQALIEYSPVAISIKDIDHRYVYISPTFEKYLPFPKAEVIGQLSTKFINPGSEKQLNNADDKVKITGQPLDTDEAFPVVFGSSTLLVTKFPIKDENGTVTGIGTVGIDITEQKKIEVALKQSEALLSGVLEIAPEGLITVDDSMTICMFNQGAERIFGYEASDVIDKSMEMLIPFRSLDKHKVHVQKFRDSSDQFRLMSNRPEVTALRKDGLEFPISASISKFETNTQLYFTVIIHDITDRKKVEEALHNAKNAAEIANQTKSQFLASMSHELRTPLNAILGFADVISHQYMGPIGTEVYKEYADDIYSSGEYLLSLVNDILDISTIEAGKQSINKIKLDAGKLVRECQATISQQAETCNIKLEILTPDNLLPFYADKRAIKQILLNLLSNSLRYTPENGIIKISTSTSSTHTIFSITDTGNGIPKNMIPGLTNLFTRAEQDPYKTTKGWGLGLAITKSLVDLHGGELKIESTVGKGTTISVHLPSLTS